MAELMSRVVDVTIEELERRQRTSEYFNRPDLWVKYMLDMDLWSKQKQIAFDVVENKNVAVKAGHGVGKSLLVALLVCWWIDTRYPNAFVASTAPSTAQIGGVVWREVRKAYNLVKRRYKEGVIDHTLPGYITADNQWKTEGGTILGFGRKPPDNKEDDAFQGLHDAYVLAIGDEATGLSEEMIDALGNITSNDGSRRIVIANPTNPACYFARLFKEDKGWSLHTISCFDSPNFTDEKDNMSELALASLVGQSYVDDKKKEYGENSPRYKARVLGEFAWDLGDTLVKPEDIAKAVETDVFVGETTPVHLGVDVARFGEDSSVIYKNEGGKIRFVSEYKGEGRVTDTAAWVHREAINANASEVRIDAQGIGGGVADVLLTYDHLPYVLIEMNSSGVTPDPLQWANARAYWWDSFRKGLHQGDIDLDLSDPSAERLHDELQSVEYKFAAKGGLLIESKDDMRKRGVKSPDFADAAVFSFADLSELFDETLKVGDKVSASAEEIIGTRDDFLIFGW